MLRGEGTKCNKHGEVQCNGIVEENTNYFLDGLLGGIWEEGDRDVVLWMSKLDSLAIVWLIVPVGRVLGTPMHFMLEAV